VTTSSSGSPSPNATGPSQARWRRPKRGEAVDDPRAAHHRRRGELRRRPPRLLRRGEAAEVAVDQRVEHGVIDIAGDHQRRVAGTYTAIERHHIVDRRSLDVIVTAIVRYRSGWPSGYKRQRHCKPLGPYGTSS